MQTVRDVMTSKVLSVRAETPIKDVARLLIDHRISGLPVVDEQQHVLGVVSEGDLLVKSRPRGSVHHRPLAQLFGESAETRQLLSKAEARTAGDAMTSPAITIEADGPIHQAASLMIEHKVNRLPVTEGGRLVGIVSRADVVATLASTDEELEQAIRDEVLLRGLWIDPDTFEVHVQDGVATIRGKVERRSTAGIVERVVAMMPGIVGVNAEVKWTTDDRDIRAPGPDYLSPKGPS